MLAPSGGRGLTEGDGSGKTEGPASGKQGMITHPSHTTVPAAGCRSAGPPLDVVEWRCCRLREAGFAPALATRLASMRVDLHELLGLVDAGCPPELAARILWPLDGDAPEAFR